MNVARADIWVYAHWQGMSAPLCIGRLTAQQAKGKRTFSFAYAKEWIDSGPQRLLDPDIGWFSGPQFPSDGKENFGVFLDSMPDTWGRTLMKRRANYLAHDLGQRAAPLTEIDFLLGVQDDCRMGALRFKLDRDGPFLGNDQAHPIPPWSSVRELQFAARALEMDPESAEVRQWLAILMAPGSSLGGARPKANLMDEKGNWWIAKFPTNNDSLDKAAWEFLTYRLAIRAGIEMSESLVEKVMGHHHTFFTKRFDRVNGDRVHFASAMTMTGHSEYTLRNSDNAPSYLELAEFIQSHGAQSQKDLHQLWRRIIFNIAISNTDDHLRNHGFILQPKGWVLSPAYDLNPSIDKAGLALLIDTSDNALSIELAKSVGDYFQLTPQAMGQIVAEVFAAVGQWEEVATQIGIPRAERDQLRGAFRVA